VQNLQSLGGYSAFGKSFFHFSNEGDHLFFGGVAEDVLLRIKPRNMIANSFFMLLDSSINLDVAVT